MTDHARWFVGVERDRARQRGEGLDGGLSRPARIRVFRSGLIASSNRSGATFFPPRNSKGGSNRVAFPNDFQCFQKHSWLTEALWGPESDRDYPSKRDLEAVSERSPEVN